MSAVHFELRFGEKPLSHSLSSQIKCFRQSQLVRSSVVAPTPTRIAEMSFALNRTIHTQIGLYVESSESSETIFADQSAAKQL
jgi:hypothetical protein